MAIDAEDYQKNLPGTRWEQKLKRLARATGKAPRRGPHGGGGHAGAALRSPRKKKGKYFAA